MNTQETHNQLADLIEQGLASSLTEECNYYYINKHEPTGLYKCCALGLAFFAFNKIEGIVNIPTSNTNLNVGGVICETLSHLASEKVFINISLHHTSAKFKTDTLTAAQGIAQKLREGFYLENQNLFDEAEII